MKRKLRWRRIGLMVFCVAVMLGLFVGVSLLHGWWQATHSRPQAATVEQQSAIVSAVLQDRLGLIGEHPRGQTYLVERQTVWPHCTYKFPYSPTSWPPGLTCKALKHWLLAEHPGVVSAPMKRELVRANRVALTFADELHVPGFDVIAALPDESATLAPHIWWKQVVLARHADAHEVLAFSRAVVSADGRRAAIIGTRSGRTCGRYCVGVLLLLRRHDNHWVVMPSRPFWSNAPPPF